MNKTFENCWKFTYRCTNHDNIVFEHKRMDDKWSCEKRDRYGRVMGFVMRTDDEMRPIFNHMQCISECEYRSQSTNSDFSVHSI